jgi:hypothetical protein
MVESPEGEIVRAEDALLSEHHKEPQNSNPE